MKKRLLAALLTLVMVCALLPATALAAYSEFVIDTAGVLTKYNGPGGHVVIPNGVTSIGAGVFFRNSYLTSITIPEGVTAIGTNAFGDCTRLTSVTIPSSVTSIGGWVFVGCDSLTSVTIPEGVTSIGTSAFSKCTGLTSVTIPDSVTSMGSNAFNGCTSLKTAGPIGGGYDIEFGWTTKIPDNAFSDCTSLTSVIIPDSVTSIGTDAFYGCRNLASVTIPASVTSIGEDALFAGTTVYGQIGSEADRYCCAHNIRFVLTDEGPHSFVVADRVLIDYSGPGRDVVVPMGVIGIGDRAFEGTALTSVTIPDSVTSIGGWVFVGCDSLTSVTIPDSVTSMGEWVFCHCTRLASITIPGGVTSIERGAFSECAGLTSVTIPEGVTTIGDYAFSLCTGLTSITIPEGVTSIGANAFKWCPNLTVYGYTNSEAETYCASEDIPFVSLGIAPGTAQEGSMESDGDESISWSITAAGVVTVTGDLAPEETVLVGCYNNNGRFTGVKWLNAQNTTTQIDPTTPNVKLFWLGAKQNPLAPSVTVWGK